MKIYPEEGIFYNKKKVNLHKLTFDIKEFILISVKH